MLAHTLGGYVTQLFRIGIVLSFGIVMVCWPFVLVYIGYALVGALGWWLLLLMVLLVGGIQAWSVLWQRAQTKPHTPWPGVAPAPPGHLGVQPVVGSPV